MSGSYKDWVKGEINKLFSAVYSERDIRRLQQCVFCVNDPSKCGGSEKDEDENGVCKKYIERN